MSDLFDTNDDLDDEMVPTDSDESVDASKEHAGTALARLALKAAFDRQSLAHLRQHPNLTIVEVPDRDWIAVIREAVKDMGKAPVVEGAPERFKQAGVYRRVGEEGLAYLRAGRSLFYISQDPDEILHEAVLAAADVRVKIAPITAALLRKLIRRVTGGVARGVRDEMARLDLSVILSIIRPERSARRCEKGLEDALKRKPKSRSATVPVLADLPLTDAVRQWSEDVLADLANVDTGAIDPADLVFGILEGPPGTGKTLIAASLARSAQWNFVSSSIGAWFASGDGALGGVAKNLRAFVDEVIAQEPSIAFLDELDALPNRATIDARSRDWWTPVITLFLTEIDRLRMSGKRIMLLGATNYYDRLDAALTRPGRLHARISVLAAETQSEVAAILRYYLGSALPEAELLKLAGIGKGATPAAVEGWVKQARSLARTEQRELIATDILRQMMPPDVRSVDDIWAISIHELGHAIVAYRLGFEVERVSIIAEGKSGGHTKMRLISRIATWSRQLDLIAVNLVGRAADILLGDGPNAGAERDLASATELLVSAWERQGLRGNLVYCPQTRMSGESYAAINAELHRQLRRAMAWIRADRDTILMLASRLKDEKVLTGDDVAKALGDASGASSVEQSSTSQAAGDPPKGVFS